MQTFFLYFGLVGLALTLPALFAVGLWRMDSHPVLDAVSRIRRHPIAVQIFLAAFVVRLILFASVKTNENRQVRTGGDPTVYGFTSNQLAAGFVLSRVDAGGSCSFAPPLGASVVEAWRLRGAADDWAPGPASASFPGGSVVFADGRIQDRVRNPSTVFAPFRAMLGVVPEANWPMIAGTNAESMVWHVSTPSNSVVVTWSDVLFLRDADTPVSVQAEFFENGDFEYRYDLGSLECRVESGELDAADLTNVVVGASLGGEPFWTTLADVATNAQLSAFGTSLSVSFRALSAEDAVSADRDGDGISTYDEMFVHGTDPGLLDSDGDGIGDGDEVAQSLDPLSVSVPNDALLARLDGFQTNSAYAAAYVAATNELVGYRLWDSFAATWPEGATNLVYERTVRIDRQSGWQHYYLSSRPDSAGGWSLSGLALEWEDSCGESGTATASPFGDSLYLPLSTNNPAFVTFRLRATSASLRSVNPVYLVGYAPAVSIEGGREIETQGGGVLTVFTEGSDSSITVSIDRSRRPCAGALHPFERGMGGLADLESQTEGGLRYEGGIDGGAIAASGAGVWRLPDTVVSGMDQSPSLRGSGTSAEGRYIVVLMPWVKYGEGECLDGGLGWDGDGYVVQYEYPLDSGCLVREWHRGSGGGRVCECTPEAGCGVEGVASVSVEVDGDTATATVSVAGEEVWSDSAVHAHGDCGGSSGIERSDECGECESGCEHGDCSALEGPSLGSLRFRIPLGSPRKGQVAGFAYLVADGPVSVTPASFMYLLRGDVGASVATNGASRTVSCACERGREVLIEPVADGVRATVRKQATGELEHTWEVVNVGGDPCEVRLRQISRLNNVMQDWTYECMENADTGGWDWRATDNISGVREELERRDELNGAGLVSETRAKYTVGGEWLGEVETVSQVVGERECAVLREVYRRESTGLNTIERHADYWRDTEHPARNGKLRLLRSNDMPWEYHEWNKDGFETLRVEQRNASPVPADFPYASSNGFENASGLADAFLTTFRYEPMDGDHAHADDCGKARCESRYVVRNGEATLIGRTWRRYTHVSADGYPAVREEAWRASSAGASPDDPSNAHSWRTVFDPVTSNTVPLAIRGETAEELDEDGVRTVRSAALSNGCVVVSARRWRGDAQFPTYEETVLDGVHGQTLRTATLLADGGAEVGWEESIYDDQGRLRSRVYSDGTSETNSYSCCRLLWSRDREGRKTLRSAQTGTDHLYYAMEEVWLGELGIGSGALGLGSGETATNGYKVTRHYFDGLGRETNTVTHVGFVPGEASSMSASYQSHPSYTSRQTAEYPFGGSDYSVVTDARGMVEARSTAHLEDRDEQLTYTYADADAQSPTLQVVQTEFRNGPSLTRRSWDGRWTERRTWSDYDAAGCRIDFEATLSSDCGAVTNSVSRHDFLGRTVCAETPGGTTATVYDGATGRALSTTSAAGDVVRTAESVYNELGELVGSAADGVTSRRDVAYEEMSNSWWRVTRAVVHAGAETNSVVETRERLTGLSDAVRAQTVRVSADGVATETTASYDPVSGLVTETVASPVDGTTVRTLLHGLVLSVSSPDGVASYAYDPLGRAVREERGAGVVERDYDAAGDVVRLRTRIGGESFAEESYAYDAFGNRVAETNALGEATMTAYDAVGNVVEVSGAAYPVRYGYDTEGRRTLLSTSRDGTIWDVTTWQYDPATGRRVAKRYADGSQTATSYTGDGLESVVTRPSLQWRESVYDARRRLVGVVSNDGSEDAAFGYDDFGRATSASNAAASYAYALHRGGIATNEAAVVGTNVFAIVRSVDAFGRLGGRGVAGGGFQTISYTEANRVGSVSDQSSVVTYACGADGSDAGYMLLLPGGATVTRLVGRDLYRPELVAYVTNVVNGSAVSWYDYAHDAAGRVTTRNSDSFAYNEKGEVVSASLPDRNDSYAYDQIGNFTDAVFGGTTNTYEANCLNQYTSILRASDSPREVSYDADGNMVSDGVFGYAYDSAGRLASVSTGGVEVASFGYDAMGRRVRKTTPEATHTYLYDGWSVVRELVERADGSSETVEYFWGRDLSGTLGGAGGVGGLLYTKRGGAVYVPLYDANGNVVQYVDAAGAVVASYAYDAFGRMLAATGPLADAFPHRFSTKYHDDETGLVYYGYRFYSPSLMRWLSRDPLGEDGGLNIYGFCQNNPVCNLDPYGLAVGLPTILGFPDFMFAQLAADAFWLTIAEYYFRHQMNAPISADMLELSMAGRVGTGEYVFPRNGQLANAIKLSSEYKDVIYGLIKDQKVGNEHYYKPNLSTDFNTHDLISAVGRAKIKVEGDICKSKSGSARLDLDVTVSDTYNFEWWGSERIKTKGFKLTAGNNIACISQMLWYLREYPWRVEFDENRRWPWR